MLRFLSVFVLISLAKGQNWNSQAQVQQFSGGLGGYPSMYPVETAGYSPYAAGMGMIDPTLAAAMGSPTMAAAMSPYGTPMMGQQLQAVDLDFYGDDLMTLNGRRFLGGGYYGAPVAVGPPVLGPPIGIGGPVYGAPIGLGMYSRPYPYYARLYDE